VNDDPYASPDLPLFSNDRECRHKCGKESFVVIAEQDDNA
jgi:hypothetical protein